MRRLPTTLPGPVRRLLRWLDEWDGEPLGQAAVPGAGAHELSRLAALGALAQVFTPTIPDDWPEELRSWVTDSKPLPPLLAEELRALLQDSSTGPDAPDLLALIYEWVVRGENRRRLGTFFTPAGLTRHMLAAAREVLCTDPVSVVDPGAGVGAFTVAAQSAWPGAALFAVDVNTVTLGLLAARMHGTTEGAPSRVSLLRDDYLSWLRDGWPALPGPRLILGNPPYTRHQHLESTTKERARAAAGGLITSGLAGLSAYFLAASLLALADDDALCLLLPGPWCETRYGRETRQWLWRQHHRAVEVQLFPSSMEVFPGTQVTAMVLVVGPRREAPQPLWVRRADIEVRDGEETVVLRESVRCDRTASCPPTFTGVLGPRRPVSLDETPLGDAAKVRRGVATGASDFFFLDDRTRDEWRLPHRALRPALVRPGHVSADRLDRRAHDLLGAQGRPRWLLDLNGSDLAVTDPCVAAYLRHGRALGVHERHLTSIRPHWYVVEPVGAADLLLSPVGRPVHRIITNDVGAVGSNNFYGISLYPSAPWTASALAQWLRGRAGQAALAQVSRHYQGGSTKVEPGALRGLQVPLDLESPTA